MKQWRRPPGREVHTVRRILSAVLRRMRDISFLIRSAILRPRSKASSGQEFLLTGWYGTETVGDQAILAGLLSVIRNVYAGPITIASLDVPITVDTLREIGADEGVEGCSYGEARTLVETGNVRAVAMAGGPVMGTIDPIVDLAEIHLAARRVGVPDGFLGCGVGPLGRTLRKMVIKNLVKGATCLTVRDSDSQSTIASLSGRRPQVSGDPAVIWLAENAPAVEREGHKRLGLSLRHWPLHEFALGRADLSHRQLLETELIRFVKRAGDEGWAIEPIAMGFLPIGGDDRVFLQQILPSPLLPANFREMPTSPRRVVEQMNRCNVVVAMRFHACLFALSLGLPVVAIDYTLGGKIDALQEQFGDRIRILDPRTLDAIALSRAVEEMQTSRSDVSDSRADLARVELVACVRRLLALPGDMSEHRVPLA